MNYYIKTAIVTLFLAIVASIVSLQIPLRQICYSRAGMGIQCVIKREYGFPFISQESVLAGHDGINYSWNTTYPFYFILYDYIIYNFLIYLAFFFICLNLIHAIRRSKFNK